MSESYPIQMLLLESRQQRVGPADLIPVATGHGWCPTLQTSEKIISEAEITKYKEELEELVQKRTSQLKNTNLKLRKEIEHRKKIDQELKAANLDLIKNEKALRNIFKDLQKALSLVSETQTILSEAGLRTRIKPSMVIEAFELLVAIQTDDRNDIYSALETVEYAKLWNMGGGHWIPPSHLIPAGWRMV